MNIIRKYKKSSILIALVLSLILIFNIAYGKYIYYKVRDFILIVVLYLAILNIIILMTGMELIHMS